jgi:hypothetical protein
MCNRVFRNFVFGFLICHAAICTNSYLIGCQLNVLIHLLTVERLAGTMCATATVRGGAFYGKVALGRGGGGEGGECEGEEGGDAVSIVEAKEEEEIE